MEFKDEVTYSQLLKDKFPDTDFDEKNRRIDFLCVKLVDTLFVIELKRPRHTLRLEDLDQVEEYVSFLKEKYIGNSPESPSRVEAYLIVGENSENRRVKLRMDALKSEGIYVKLYNELLAEARQYHNEFIVKYEQLKRSNKDEKV